MDQYLFNDTDSALTVIGIYGLTGLFFSLYLFGKRLGLKALMGLEAIMLGMNLLYTVGSVTQMFDPGLHDPLSSTWLTLTQILFSALTLFLTIKVSNDTG